MVVLYADLCDRGPCTQEEEELEEALMIMGKRLVVDSERVALAGALCTALGLTPVDEWYILRLLRTATTGRDGSVDIRRVRKMLGVIGGVALEEVAELAEFLGTSLRTDGAHLLEQLRGSLRSLRPPGPDEVSGPPDVRIRVVSMVGEGQWVGGEGEGWLDAHSGLLRSRSAFFRNALSPTPPAPSTSSSSFSVLRTVIEATGTLTRASAAKLSWEVDCTALPPSTCELVLNALYKGGLPAGLRVGASGPMSLGWIMEVAHAWDLPDMMDQCVDLLERELEGSCPTVDRAGVVQLLDFLTLNGLEQGRDACLAFVMSHFDECVAAVQPDVRHMGLGVTSKRHGLDQFVVHPTTLALLNHKRLHLLPEPNRDAALLPSLIRSLTADLDDLRRDPMPGVEVFHPPTWAAPLSPVSQVNLNMLRPLVIRLHGPALVGTPWEGQEVLLKLKFSTLYPAEGPQVLFISRVRHPCVEPTSGVLYPKVSRACSILRLGYPSPYGCSRFTWRLSSPTGSTPWCCNPHSTLTPPHSPTGPAAHRSRRRVQLPAHTPPGAQLPHGTGASLRPPPGPTPSRQPCRRLRVKVSKRLAQATDPRSPTLTADRPAFPHALAVA